MVEATRQGLGRQRDLPDRAIRIDDRERLRRHRERRSCIRPSTSSTRCWPGPAMAGGSPSTLWRWADGHGPRALRAKPSTADRRRRRPSRREQTRARYPDVDGLRRARAASGPSTRSTARASRPSCSCPRGRSSIRATGSCRSPTSPGASRVITFDGRGNGRSDRPTDPRGVPRGGIRRGCARGDGRDRNGARGRRVPVEGRGTVAAPRGRSPRAGRGRSPSSLRRCRSPRRCRGRARTGSSDEPRDTYDGWGKYNRHYWVEHYEDFLEFFFSQCLTEPHSTKPHEDTVGWGLETDAPTLVATQLAPRLRGEADVRALLSRIDCPDPRDPRQRRSRAPVRIGCATRRAGERRARRHSRGRATSPMPATRSRSTCCSATSSGCVRSAMTRDDAGRGRSRVAGARCTSPRRSASATPSATSAIADELRALHPDLEIDWLAQHPVTAVLETRGERIHPLSAELASESAHITAESSEHDLNAFQAIRRMDEILVANFMVFHDAVETGEYDLVIGDEAWDVDHFLHENPELKRTAFAWMTDFVGWLPMPDGRRARGVPDGRLQRRDDRARRALPAPPRPGDLRRQPGRHRARRLRSGAAVDPRLDGAPLRVQRLRHGVRPVAARRASRGARVASLGSSEDERVVIVTVGGSGVGEALLRRVVAAGPTPRRRVNGLRMIVVAGPRIDPASPRCAGRRRGPGVRARPVPPSRRVRPRGRPGRPDDHDGAGRGAPAVPVLPPPQPFRAEPPRPPSARALRRGSVHGLRRVAARGHRRGDRRRDRPAGRLSRRSRPMALRAQPP